MFHRILRHALAGAFLGVMVSTGAVAAGLSANQSATVLGQPLDFPVQVRLDAAETLTPECVNAEVHVSDQRLPPTAVRTVIDQQGSGLARVRVQTQMAIEEPVISITLRVGCAAPISRRFVVFADPPAGSATAAPLASAYLPATAPALSPPLSPAPALATAPAASPAVAPPPSATPANAMPADTAAAATGTTARATAQARGAEGQAARSARAAPAAAGTRTAPAPSPAKAVARAAERPAATSPPPAAAAGGPRLTLEAALPPPSTAAAAAPAPASPTRATADAVDDAFQAVAQAASAARLAAQAASASLDRMASLEQTVAQLRAQSAAQQALVSQLRDKLDQSQGSGPWLWPLLLVALLLAGLSAWLAWRLGRLQAARHLAWTQQQAAASGAASSAGPRSETAGDRQSRTPTGPAPFISSDMPTLPPRSGLGSLQSPVSSVSSAAAAAAPAGFITQPSLASRVATPGWPVPSSPRGRGDLPDITPLDTPVDEPMARTEPIPAPLRGGGSGGRDVSIEELIDLEQQAEFFVVLGQDEAAIDLLVDHLRSTGGGSPLPYLKLLEIYSRTNDRSAYERNRARFNHRFNAYAPEWGSDLAHGRSLEDYPGILPRLEQVWPRPLDAMAELEALLFRKSRGELFELPAYREVLFLYALARDLLDREAASTGSVDLLLPLADGSAFGATAPIPLLYDEAQTGEPQFDFDDRPTAPVDFDLTIPAQQTSMFDPMDEPLRPRRR